MIRAQSGTALVVVLLGIGLVSAVGFGLSLSSSLVRLAAANHDEATTLANASEAGLELAVRELARIDDWNAVLRDGQTSTLVDGEAGVRYVAPGLTIDLERLTNRLTCGRDTLCTDAQTHAMSLERPWGANNPWWRLFVHQPLTAAPMPAAPVEVYVVVWIGDDARETDGNSLIDGAGDGQEGRYTVRARSESFARRGGRHAIEADLSRICSGDVDAETCLPGIRVHSWRVATGWAP